MPEAAIAEGDPEDLEYRQFEIGPGSNEALRDDTTRRKSQLAAGRSRLNGLILSLYLCYNGVMIGVR